VTPAGQFSRRQFLRLTRIKALPQLIYVLRGDVDLVMSRSVGGFR
jgi:lipopolysaccharide/colanic/teichoic acid biosynthesis glycosyltransferase